MTHHELDIKSVYYRQEIIKVIKKANAGHTGGDLSCIDILNVLYNYVLNISPANFTDPNRDRFIQSKGHSVEALYVVLADVGFFPVEELNTVCRYGSHFVGHPTRSVNGIEQNTGALGHGLSLCVGMALAGKMDRRSYRVFCLLGDGELAEGSNWEAILSAAHHKLDNLFAVIDYNQLQITGATRSVCNTDPLDEKFRAFGWTVRHTDGHAINELMRAFDQEPVKDKPTVIIAHTVKGKGISFIENDPSWHHKVPNENEFTLALQELNLQMNLITNAQPKNQNRM